MRRAYEDLERAGVIATRQGKGSVVAERSDLPTALMHDELRRQLEALLAIAARLGLTRAELQRLLGPLGRHQLAVVTAQHCGRVETEGAAGGERPIPAGGDPPRTCAPRATARG